MYMTMFFINFYNVLNIFTKIKCADASQVPV